MPISVNIQKKCGLHLDKGLSLLHPVLVERLLLVILTYRTRVYGGYPLRIK